MLVFDLIELEEDGLRGAGDAARGDGSAAIAREAGAAGGAGLGEPGKARAMVLVSAGGAEDPRRGPGPARSSLR